MAATSPLIAVGQLYEVVSYTAVPGQAGLNVFHYRCSATTVPGTHQITDILAALVTSGYPAAIKALMCDAATYYGLTVRIIQPIQSVMYADKTGAGSGSVAGDLLPKQTAGFLRKKSSQAGQRKGGRFYVPFPCEADNQADSTPSSSYGTRLTTLAAKLLSQLTIGGDTSIDPIIYRRPTNVLAYGYREIADIIPLAKWATQRRRSDFNATNPIPL